MIEIKRDGLDPQQTHRRMVVMREDVASFAERFGQAGFRMMPDGGPYGATAVAVDATHHKLTKRQLKIERKEVAAQQVDREEITDAISV